MDGTTKRALIAQSHALGVGVLVGDGEPADTVVAHLRQAFRKSALLKVRVQTDDREACERVSAALTTRVPCELVKRIGRVLVLYCEANGPAESEDA